MFTRSFLFLLAMVTGFSAAQAGDSLRHTPAAVGAAASVVQSAVVLWSNEAKPTKAHSAILTAVLFDRADYVAYPYTAPQIIVAPRVHIGDRNRQ
jgi:hypothetical protein